MRSRSKGYCKRWKEVPSRALSHPVRRCASYGEGIYTGGVYAGGPYRTCRQFREVGSVLGHPVRRCSVYAPTRVGMGGAHHGSAANEAAARRNPWLAFLREWRKRTGSNDLHLASMEYRKLHGVA
jgi:hypothetical protein